MRTFLLGLTLFALGLASALILIPGAGARSAIDGTLTGSVGSSGNPNAAVISLSAETVAPGTYQLDVTDFATVHNFHFCNKGVNSTTCAVGAAVNLSTSVENAESASWTVTLAEGTYIYICDPHHLSMHGTLVVGNGGTTTTDTTSTTTTTPVLKLKILSTTAKRKVVTVKVKASQLGHITGVLLDKNSTTLATTATDGTTVTLKLRPAAKLANGKYTVMVTVECCGTSAMKMRKVLVM